VSLQELFTAMRKLIGILIVLFLLNSASAAGEKVFVIKVEGVIDPITSEYVERSIKTAESAGAEALIIQMDTPGGLDASMRSIIKNILESKVPVVVYVYPRGARAASAGSFILISSHIAAMSPGTNVGAAHPVALGGETPVSEKITNDAAAYIRSLAEERGRNPELAESFVRNSTSITAREALEQGIIEIIAEDYSSLLNSLNGREVETKDGNKTLHTAEAEIEVIPLSPREEFLHILSDPNIAYILFIAGFYGIIFELSNPGAILPGIVGGICILLALWSFQALSISAVGVALIVFALLLFLAETQVPSHGLLAVGGTISLLLGSIMLIDIEKEPFLRISYEIIITATLITALFFAVAVSLIVKTHKKKPITGAEGMIGLTGEVKEDLSPEGEVFVHGELWRARAKEGEIKRGKKVKVVGVENLILIVEEVSRQ
jgi:membrane-bound serine protease (ClpP class)